MEYVRVLIQGETFRSIRGTGITLTNLFQYWHLKVDNLQADQKKYMPCMKRDPFKLKITILKLWNDSFYRNSECTNVVRTALTNSNSTDVREEFRKALNIF
jgi:hypothetical protein